MSNQQQQKRRYIEQSIHCCVRTADIIIILFRIFYECRTSYNKYFTQCNGSMVVMKHKCSLFHNISFFITLFQRYVRFVLWLRCWWLSYLQRFINMESKWKNVLLFSPFEGWSRICIVRVQRLGLLLTKYTCNWYKRRLIASYSLKLIGPKPNFEYHAMHWNCEKNYPLQFVNEIRLFKILKYILQYFASGSSYFR